MTFWPELRYASDVAILIDAASYWLRLLSYCSASNFSLLKCCGTAVVSPCNESQESEIYLHCFIVDQRIDSRSRGFIIRLIGLTTELCPADHTDNQDHLASGYHLGSPPRRGSNRKPCVARHSQQGDICKICAKFVRLPNFSILSNRSFRRPARIPHTMLISRAVGAM